MSSPIINHIAQSLGLSSAEAQEALDTWVTSLHEQTVGGTVAIDGLGTFDASGDQPLAFAPAAPLDFLVNQSNTPPLSVEPPPAPDTDAAPLPDVEPIGNDAEDKPVAKTPSSDNAAEPTTPEAPISGTPTAESEEIDPNENQSVVAPHTEEPVEPATPATIASDPIAPEDLNKGIWQPPQRKDSPLGPLPEKPYEEADFSVVPDSPLAPQQPPSDLPEDPSAEPDATASFLSELIDLASGTEPSEIEEEVSLDGPFDEPEPASPPEETVEIEEDETPAPVEATSEPDPPSHQPETVVPVPIKAEDASPYAPPSHRTTRPPERYTPTVEEPDTLQRNRILMGIGGIVLIALVAWFVWPLLRPATPPDTRATSEPETVETIPVTPSTQPSDSTTLAAQPDSTTIQTPEPEPEPEQTTQSTELFGTAGFEQTVGTYTIVVGSASTLEAAYATTPQFRDRGLRTAILHGTYREVTSYRVAVGQFSTKEAAIQARAEHTDLLVEGAWVMRVYQRFTIYNSSSD